jgi:SAM-dependent methyltransferase
MPVRDAIPTAAASPAAAASNPPRRTRPAVLALITLTGPPANTVEAFAATAVITPLSAHPMAPSVEDATQRPPNAVATIGDAGGRSRGGRGAPRRTGHTLRVDPALRDYLDPRFEPDRLDRAIPRRATLDALRAHAPQLSGTVLDVGCGHQPYRSVITGPGTSTTAYIGLDLKPTIYQAPDLVWDGLAMPLASGSIDAAVATEILEHVPDPAPLLREVHRVLAPGAALFLTVPFLWPLHDVPYDEYRYTPFSLERKVREAGFDDVSVRALGGWDASLGQLLALWVRRRPMGHRKRKVLATALTPVVRRLARSDQPPATFGESTMLTALAAVAHKAG